MEAKKNYSLVNGMLYVEKVDPKTFAVRFTTSIYNAMTFTYREVHAIRDLIKINRGTKSDLSIMLNIAK